MHTMTALGCAAVLGFVVAGPQAPQGKEAVAGAGQMPRLADVLKGYVGQECCTTWGDHVCLNFDAATVARTLGADKKTLEVVGQDFVKLSGELLVPISSLIFVTGKKP